MVAVLALKTGELKEAAADFAHDKETARLTGEPASSTKAIRNALVTMHIQTPQSQYHFPVPGGYTTVIQTPTPLNPFAGAEGH